MLKPCFPLTVHFSKRSMHSFEYVSPSDPQTGKYIRLQIVGHSVAPLEPEKIISLNIEPFHKYDHYIHITCVQMDTVLNLFYLLFRKCMFPEMMAVM